MNIRLPGAAFSQSTVNNNDDITVEWAYILAKVVYHLLFDDTYAKEKYVCVAQSFGSDAASCAGQYPLSSKQ